MSTESHRGRTSRLALCPLTLREANAFVQLHHRHHKPVRGCICVVGCEHEGEVCGVAIIGRPLARMLQDGYTAEVTRLCTDGTRNACSILYAASWRATRALGYRKLITYTLKSEPGTSLQAAGWRIVGEVERRSWHRPSRPRVDQSEPQERWRWEVAA